MPTQTYYIDVAPRLAINHSKLPLDALSVISVLSKFMGKYPSDFEKHLNGISQRGYNMVHFTPLMMRGDSNSPYSIYDQHTFDKQLFPGGEADIADLVKKMESEYNLLALTDVVWNHTANNSKWLEEHPEAGYNINTAPWLQSAYELDSALLRYSNELSSRGLPTTLNSVDDLLRIMDGIKTHVIGAIRLWEFYVVNVEATTKATVTAWMENNVKYPTDSGAIEGVQDWSLKQKADWLIEHALSGGDRLGERYHRKVDPQIGGALLQALFGRYNSRVNSMGDERSAVGTMTRFLNEVNLEFYREYDADISEMMEQVFNRTKYMRLDDHGPKVGPITVENPLIESYFTRLPQNETTKEHDPGSLALVNNGWIWAADVMKDNAGPKSKAYLRREVIVWGDCVKLRYGSGPEDSPFLWEFMGEYTRLMAKYFHGFRIDNCHSTPLHLAEYMLDQARSVRPDLVVMAELFSGSEKMDYVYVERLGLACLIREAMQTWSTAEMSKLVHKHCGRPIGSFELDEISSLDKPSSATNGQANGSQPSVKEAVHKIRPSEVHALLMDCTHDNEMPAQRRDARDTLSNGALVAMCASAVGSVFGYDEVYPELIELVHEKRPYTSPYSNMSTVHIGAGPGVGSIKRLLNQLHTIMGKDGYDETHIHHDGEYITVHRLHPKSRKGYFLIAHTAFPGYGNGNAGFPPVDLSGTRVKQLGAWNLEVDQSGEAKHAAMSDKVLRGLPSQTKDLRGFKIETHGDNTKITVPDKFPPGSIALFETWIPSAEHSEGLDKYVTSGAREAFSGCNLNDLNTVLYRCEPEERVTSDGKDGSYTIPNYGPLVYCGLQGWWSVLKDIIANNDLGHPLCNHLREGQWALDYTIGRLQSLASRNGYEGLNGPIQWLQDRFSAIRKIPNFLLPRYFALVIQTAYKAAYERAIEQMSENVQHGQKFLKDMSMVSVQLTGYMKNASLWPEKLVPSLAAGLPHFASDWARCWGRDIFIALRGLLLCTGRFEDAKEHIKAFASVVKHGMVPNLLGSGKLPRYNSRDSVWFFLQNIQDYCKLAPNGTDVLKERLPRRFLPYDDTWFPHDDKRAYSQSSTVEDVIQECLQRHASGMHFREYNAGPGIDSQMRDPGFNIDIEVDWNTGIIFGGNQWNCGTWMDKMGESERAGSKGVPGTSRDGAPVEITGLLYSTLKWVDELRQQGLYRYDGVSLSGSADKVISYKDWAAKIRNNFERCYYVPVNASEDKNYDVNTAVVNRRGIYKDIYRCSKEYRDYQLRPNYPIAMTVAPDLFDPDHALNALVIADKYLVKPYGMATLDPGDMEYRPNYINSEDSSDFHTSKGRNYHQGPEWLWPRGFFLRALLKFDLMRRNTPEERVEAFQQVTQRLGGCMRMIRESPWAGLTELTNENGSHCGDSVSFLCDVYAR
ncbi:bifunctional 4-alpha-glucanotransferase/amylo-alpha-1,6-glucosidase [Zalaria obscura]|uniref:Bifunctional 4-alpha-glucanotransferase/amylo-alpha-1,6-glucosidase n=1 Tax=Zalaria obscura TaxID=2024903 RepID=A0ACC3SJT5_9PEZI